MSLLDFKKYQEKSKERTQEKKTVNPEGFEVYKDNPYRKVILQGLSFNPNRRTFYYDTEQIIEEFKKGLDEIEDKDFLGSLAHYLAVEHQRKSSPVFILAYLTSLLKNGEYTNKDKLYLYFRNPNIFNTPKRIAEYFASYEYLTNESIKKVPKGIKRRLKQVFETYDEITLKKNKLKRKPIKTADLIKILRPKPKDKELAKLYTAIIENDNYASLKEEDKKASITQILSDNTKTKEEKTKTLEEVVDTIPINQLLRNISKYESSPEEVKDKIRKRLKSVLQDIKNGRALRLFNIFDLFIDSPFLGAEIEELINEVLYEYLIDNRVIPENVDKISIVYDLSGSMTWSSDKREIKDSNKILTTLSYLYSDLPVDRFICFDEKYGEHINEYLRIIENTAKRPLTRYIKLNQWLINLGDSQYGGATSLIRTIEENFENDIEDNKERKLIILITDEVTWSDNEQFSFTKYKIESLKNFLRRNPNFKLLFYNPAYIDGKVVATNNVLRIASLSSSLITMLNIFSGKLDNLVKYIKENY